MKTDATSCMDTQQNCTEYSKNAELDWPHQISPSLQVHPKDALLHWHLVNGGHWSVFQSSVAVAYLLPYQMCSTFRDALLHNLLVTSGWVNYFSLRLAIVPWNQKCIFTQRTAAPWIFSHFRPFFINLGDDEILTPGVWHKQPCHIQSSFFLTLMLGLNFSRLCWPCLHAWLDI